MNPITHQLIRVSNHTYISSHTVCELLHKIVSAGLTTPITLVLENAAYQRCQLVQGVARQLGIELFVNYTSRCNIGR